MKNNPITFGNLTIHAQAGIVNLTLNTEVRDRAHCLFTADSIPQLVQLLLSAQGKAQVSDPDDDQDILDMV